MRFEIAEVTPKERERVRAEMHADFARRPEHYAKLNVTTSEQIDEVVRHSWDCDTFKNDTYTVSVFRDGNEVPPFPKLWHFSIKRNDREPIHDWRELMAIKDAIAGEDHEAVELYPARERVVDTANQYHLWVLAEPGLRFPFGFSKGLISDDVGETRARQRPGSGAKR